MNQKVKSCIVISLVLVSFVLISIRVIFVNKKAYSVLQPKLYRIGDIFEYDGMQMQLSDYKIYKGEELNSQYNNELSDIIDEYDILFNLTITNVSNTVKQYNASASGMMYGYESGGNVNPYLYQYFNPNTKGIISLEKDESKTVTLAFPIDVSNENIEYVVSLYPENIRVKLK